MSRIDFNRFLEDLCAISAREAIDPASIVWPESADPDAWYFTPELISLYGTDVWSSLDDRRRKRLSLAEAVNFFSLNIHGEQYLVQEISRCLFQSDEPQLSRYLLHFIEEETRHMMYFSTFCERYAAGIYPDRTIRMQQGGDDQLEMFLLFARINVFEEISDHYNRVMAKDERLAPIVRDINHLHHVEELRHLRFGRRFLARHLESLLAEWGGTRRRELREQLSAYLKFVWKQYYNPDAYADAGIDDAFGVWRTAASAAPAAAHRREVERRRLSYLRKLELLEAA